MKELSALVLYSLPWALAPISALAPITGGVFRLENTKRNRADVRPPCEKSPYTQVRIADQRTRVLETPVFLIISRLTADERNERPAEHLVRADGLL